MTWLVFDSIFSIWRTKCPRIIWCSSYPKLGISYFSKRLWFLVVGNYIWRSQSGHSDAYCNSISHVSRHFWWVYIFNYKIACKFIIEFPIQIQSHRIFTYFLPYHICIFFLQYQKPWSSRTQWRRAWKYSIVIYFLYPT